MQTFEFLRAYVESLPRNALRAYLLRSGKNPSEIVHLAQREGLALPRDLVDFYGFSYGADLDEYRILTIPEIVNTLEEMRDVYGDQWRTGLLPFGRLMGVGDFIVFDLERSRPDGTLILDGFHELNPSDWGEICFGLETWLRRMVDNDFRPFWLG